VRPRRSSPSEKRCSASGGGFCLEGGRTCAIPTELFY
jgi:hypothetical protein